jgi:ribonuclease BN (tRNA processing enzyme)
LFYIVFRGVNFVQLTILGCYGPYPPAGGACSGYLLEADDTAVLLDCGNGVLSRLQQYLPFWKLDAVILSHLHADHCADLAVMRYGLEMAYNRGLRSEPLPLYAPAEPAAEFERLPYKNAYKVEKIVEGGKLSLGPFSASFRFGVHAVPSVGIRIDTAETSLVYSGDTEYHSGLEELARDARLFLCEANYLEADLKAGLPNHLSAGQAAQVADAAGVKELVLTHHHPESDPATVLAEATKHFPSALMAVEGSTFVIS